ncbi:hypothetical protein [Dysgonomonas termitidis]|uniref:Lipoprotein n=1 Tax=Dysgonomonas termitidis TaxID=1516126 RepID=A0ABV9KZA3_9BACT
MKYIVLFICILALSSCFSQKEVIKSSTIKIEGGTAGIRSLINIDGYYPISSELRYGAITFFEDGTWVYFGFKSGIPIEEIKKNMSESVLNWSGNKQIRWGVDWGVYTIQNDTIIVHSYDKPALLKALAISEIRYKVVDKNTIQRIYFRIISKADDDYYKTNSPWRYQEPMHFTPADSIPPSDNWLKENKWIWRNESDWKDYMQKVEQKKKQFKKK